MAQGNSRKFTYQVANAARTRTHDDGTMSKMREMMKDLDEGRGEFEEGTLEYQTPKKMDVSRIIQTIAEIELRLPHETEENEKRRWSRMCAEVDFYEDVNGIDQLNTEGVISARKLELDFFKKVKVYEKVLRSEARGHKMITTRWVDTNKGDNSKPDLRSRLAER